MEANEWGYAVTWSGYG